MRVKAVVVGANPPWVTTFSRRLEDWVDVVADLGSGPLLLRAVERMDTERWLLAGMEVEIDADPATHNRHHPYALDWESVRPIGELVARQDPLVTEPVPARNAARRARAGARPLYPDIQDQWDWSTDEAVHDSLMPLEEAVAQCRSLRARDGMVRGVGVVVAWRQAIHSERSADDFGAPSYRTPEGSSTHGHPGVVAITIPGRRPYAHFAERFKVPYYCDHRGWLPMQISQLNQDEVCVEWQEVEAAGGIYGRVSSPA